MISSTYSRPDNEFVHIDNLIKSAVIPVADGAAYLARLENVRNSAALAAHMTIKEKIGQKIMLDFRLWRESGADDSVRDMEAITESIRNIIVDYNIGGIKLFSNNLKDKNQIGKLTASLKEIIIAKHIPLFIATDNEGGNVFRLPRRDFFAFPGNMALAAAYDDNRINNLAYLQGCVMARDLLAAGINTNFAPVLDVNSHQDNPVINVRSFGDHPATVAILGRQMIKGFGDNGVISVAKHFPGHGNTEIDSHLGLPVVNRNRQDAEAIDLAPYRRAIEAGDAPDMIMTAHIQYPALDDSLIRTRDGEDIVIPATLSGKIQTDLLRNELKYTGVTITDALDMGAISEKFDIDQVMEQLFNAGVDIALMPVSLRSPDDRHKLERLIDTLAQKISAGVIDENTVSASVGRILSLKARRLGGPPPDNPAVDASLGRRLEKYIADHSVTLLKNSGAILPLVKKDIPLYLLMPWNEQGEALQNVLTANGFSAVRRGRTDDVPWQTQQREIEHCAMLIIGSLSMRASPVESNAATDQTHTRTLTADQAIQRAIAYARRQRKKIVFLSLRAPYDVVNYLDSVDAVLATYSYYGEENGEIRGCSLHSAAEIIAGKLPPRGQLPVDIYNIDAQGHAAQLRFARGFGLAC
ncbi:glycoside hydrolase family 3 protein [Martelella alba]|uniref:beta-N-acetylhexosaminidase n=1 Tax=Martelella alba TaxID=2590451 RepID=A0ABY2SPZ9_9HYPH|nr:glycoside hydrolase family 3 protein [Martelella alba]TKI05914.1 glycoside hydrolase family 3 protein [Martelella alba]